MKAIFLKSILTLFVVSSFFSCKKGADKVDPKTKAISPATSTFEGTMAADWLNLHLDLIKSTPGFVTPVAARSLGYSSLALYESLVYGMPGYNSLNGQLNGLTKLPLPDSTQEYNWALAASTAQYALLSELFITTSDKNKIKIDSIRRIYENKLKIGTTDEVIDRSIRFGAAIATAINEYSKTDGGHTGHANNFPQSYTLPTGIGFWKPTSSQLIPLLPYWGKNRTMAKTNMTDGLKTPIQFSFEKNSAFFLEAKNVYDLSKTLTAEQKAIAKFFTDGTGTITSSGHHFNIAKKILLDKKSKLDEAAFVYANVGLALNDALVSCWRGKYTYNLMRPSTYINQTIDKNWTPVLANPPFPDYASDYSTSAGATVAILESIFGKTFAFEDNTYEGILPNRKYDNFEKYGQETSYSRIYGGNHFPFSCIQGYDNGKNIGKNILNLKFKK